MAEDLDGCDGWFTWESVLQDIVIFCRISCNALECSRSCKTSVYLAGQDSVNYGTPERHNNSCECICHILL